MGVRWWGGVEGARGGGWRARTPPRKTHSPTHPQTDSCLERGKVGQQHPAPAGEQHVLRLQVPVHDAGGVNGGQRVQHLERHPPLFGRGQEGAGAQPGGHAGVGVRAQQVGAARGFVRLCHGQHVGEVEAGQPVPHLFELLFLAPQGAGVPPLLVDLTRGGEAGCRRGQRVGGRRAGGRAPAPGRPAPPPIPPALTTTRPASSWMHSIDLRRRPPPGGERRGWGGASGRACPRPARHAHQPTTPPHPQPLAPRASLKTTLGTSATRSMAGAGRAGVARWLPIVRGVGGGGRGWGGGGGGGADTGRVEGVGVGGSGAWVQGWTGRGAAAGGQRSKRSVVAIARSCPALRRPAWGDGWWWRTICARGCANPQGRSAGRAWHARPAALGPTLRRAAPAVLHTPSAPARAEWRPNPRPTPPCVAPHAHLRPAPPSAPHHGRRQR